MNKLLAVLALALMVAPAAPLLAAAAAENPAPAFESDAPRSAAATADLLEPQAACADDLTKVLETAPAAAYECPDYTIYCSRASQCVDYCGSVEFAVCQFGCCACAG